MKFTKEEISLCKQVAEKHRKQIEEGDWYLPYSDDEEPEVYLAGITDDKANVIGIPILSISDCLEFFEKKGFNQDFHFKRFKNGNWSFTAEDNKYKKVRGEGETKKAACLKAVLAVIEEGE